ncbi:hypothetical protein MFIFM68171_07074 [Madurella fahalii]|uniref:Dihydrodipicolinate synthase n=1 Tax=Madurella fahalii TaxID=1157608 RepID=A0ABQ0GGJ9_9PEZI
MASTTTSPIPPRGVWVPSPTFFLPSSSSKDSLQPPVDIQAQINHSVFLAKSGITGIVLLGSTGEAVHLSSAERSTLISSVRQGLNDAGFPDYPLMAGVLAPGLDETLEWLDVYAEAGAQWGLVLTPGYFGPATTQAGITEWYTIVADKSPIPVLVYNYPGVTNGVHVLPETYRELARHERIVGCKMSHGNISHHVQVSLDPAIDHDKFRVYSGFGNQLAPIVEFGAAGVIDGMAAFYPKTVVRLMSLVEQELSGEALAQTRAEIRRLQFVVSLAEEFVMRNGVIGIKEATCRVAGFGTLEGGRLPIKGRLPPGAWEEAERLFLAEIAKTETSL